MGDLSSRLFRRLPRLKRRRGQPILEKVVPVDEICALRIVRPAVPHGYRIGNLVTCDDDIFPFDDRLCPTETVVRSRQGKTMKLTAAFDDQTAFDLVKMDSDLFMPNAHRVESGSGMDYIGFFVSDTFRCHEKSLPHFIHMLESPVVPFSQIRRHCHPRSGYGQG
jgi:hypothetical protein